jgi:hypothetical protein
MYLAWRRFLPLSLNYLLFFVGVRCFIYSRIPRSAIKKDTRKESIRKMATSVGGNNKRGDY